MKVILLKDIKGSGKAGDIINTSDGHARNYLIPRGLAKEANESNISQLNHQQKSRKKKADEAKAAAQDIAERLSKIKLVMQTKSGEGGRLFGSITNKDISEKIKELSGIDIDKKKISLETVKQIGVHDLNIKLHPGVSAELKLHVEEEK